MKIEALNCPNCGASVPDNSIHCGFCDSRLKTMACSKCLGTIFEGGNFCPLCGKRAFRSQIAEGRRPGDCPRCRIKLSLLQIEDIGICTCEKCEGLWLDPDTFEEICADQEKQAAVLQKLDEIMRKITPEKIRYVPCPECKDLMNRSNFARVSGVIIDMCKLHGVWFDAEELPRIIEFIRKGGLDLARDKEKRQIQSEREQLRADKFKQSVEQYGQPAVEGKWNSGNSAIVREFINFLFD